MLVDDQHRVADQPADFAVKFAGVVGVGEPVDPLAGGGELNPVSGPAASDRQPGGL